MRHLPRNPSLAEARSVHFTMLTGRSERPRGSRHRAPESALEPHPEARKQGASNSCAAAELALHLLASRLDGIQETPGPFREDPVAALADRLGVDQLPAHGHGARAGLEEIA